MRLLLAASYLGITVGCMATLLGVFLATDLMLVGYGLYLISVSMMINILAPTVAGRRA